ncbi:MAG: hypothetical protein KBC30_08350 [Planctomycetes bacterium]|nr:hypothetical protein [Planctomycetota bacterium]HPY74813.1 hypothetical protein [Planctomycetota bacterium]HQB00453.1 hypothetical protein [Planctomycetota bacterium]
MKKLFLFLFVIISSILYADTKNLSGQIHSYKDRYVFQDTEKENCYILLENNILVKLLEKLQPKSQYEVEGEIYKFKNMMYLLATKFTLIEDENTLQELTDLEMGLEDIDDEDEQIQQKEKKKLKKSKKNNKKIIKKPTKNKKSNKTIKGAKKNKKSNKTIKGTKKNKQDKKLTTKNKKLNKASKNAKKKKKSTIKKKRKN